MVKPNSEESSDLCKTTKIMPHLKNHSLNAASGDWVRHRWLSPTNRFDPT